MHPETAALLEKLLVMLRDDGEKKVFRYIRKELMKNGTIERRKHDFEYLYTICRKEFVKISNLGLAVRRAYVLLLNRRKAKPKG